jgi:hypothetical protein
MYDARPPPVHENATRDDVDVVEMVGVRVAVVVDVDDLVDVDV